MQKYILSFVLILLSFSCASINTVKDDEGTRLIADIKPVKVARIGVSFEKFFSNELSKSDVGIVFHPRTNDVTLEFSYQMNRNVLFISESVRSKLISSISSFSSEYEARSLNAKTNKSKTRKVYGLGLSRLEWGVISLNGEAAPELMFGYIFTDPTSPYFTISIPKTENINGQTNDEKGDEYSIETNLFFTRGQAIALGQALLQETLEAAIDPADLPSAIKEAKEEYTTK
ncbi:MAG: hypothetical protein WCT14_09255 [Treponemataceae bacterium]